MGQRAVAAVLLHLIGFVASYLLSRWKYGRLGAERMVHGPADPLSSALDLVFLGGYALGLLALAVWAWRSYRLANVNSLRRLLIVGPSTALQAVLAVALMVVASLKSHGLLIMD